MYMDIVKSDDIEMKYRLILRNNIRGNVIDENTFLEAIRNDYRILAYIDQEYSKKEREDFIRLLKLVLKENPLSFIYIKNKTDDIIDYALNLDPTLIQYINNPTQEHKDKCISEHEFVLGLLVKSGKKLNQGDYIRGMLKMLSTLDDELEEYHKETLELLIEELLEKINDNSLLEIAKHDITILNYTNRRTNDIKLFMIENNIPINKRSCDSDDRNVKRIKFTS